MTGSVELPDTSSVEALLGSLSAAYAAARPSSRRANAAACALLPGGNTRTQLHFQPFPFYVEHADGSRLWDVDGREYLDLVNNYTSLVHGHGHGTVVGAVQKQASRGTAVGAPTELEIELARELTSRVPSIERLRFTNSGTEAVLYAARTARIATGRDRLIKIEGSYHGGAESVQVSVRHLHEGRHSVAEPGVPGALAETVDVIPADDAAVAVEVIHQVGDGAAAVMVEPMLGGTTMVPLPRSYLEAVATGARDVGALLVFDEVLTLRLAHGGLQERHGIIPDLTALGKIIGGGLPVGAVGGAAELMDVWDPRHHPDRYNAGTFNANPITMAAGIHALGALTRQEIERINGVGDRLRRLLNERARRAGVPLVASGMGSLMQVHAGVDPPTSHRDAAARPRDLVRCLFFLLLQRGVFVTPRGTANISTAVSDAECEQVAEAITDSLDVLAGLSTS